MGTAAIKANTDTPESSPGHTPMMAQYMAIKAAHPDCLIFYRMGDFYELFFNDAITAAGILDIALTKRGKTKGEEIPMAGVPAHSYEPYLAKLIRAGHKVAICEQTETPEDAKKRGGYKALVTRDVTRIVTQGTVTEDNLLNPRENNYLAALCDAGGQIGLAWLQITTGEFYVQPVPSGGTTAALERIGASEIILPEKMETQGFGEISDIKLSRLPQSLFDSQNGQKRLEKLFGVNTLEAFGGFSRAEIAAAGALVDYIDRTQKGRMPFLSRPERISPGGTMEIDAATRRNLELTRTLSGDRRGSLLSCIDRTITGPGARTLQARLSAPLCDPAAITHRLDEISCFIDDARLRETVREILKSVPDMERALARLGVDRGGPRDLGALREGLSHAETLRGILMAGAAGTNSLKDIYENLRQAPDIQQFSDRLKSALEGDLPFLDREGGFIRAGYSAKLDDLRALRDNSRRLIAGLQEKYQKHTSIDSLKISYNNVLGYFIEVPAKRADALMVRPGAAAGNDNPYVHRQTMAGAVRFTTAELAELERDISSASEKSIAIEQEMFRQMCSEAVRLAASIGTAARALAVLDTAAALAELAVDMNYVRPLIDNSLAFDIKGGRHPVVEQALRSAHSGHDFVPNDCDLGPGNRLWLLTGPNMAGKSTFLRQNALIAILAQMGSYVPATGTHIGVVDKLFSRVGAADDLARGRSTFMVEMVETAAILNQSTPRSLVILDEIGRGTATFDGLSIAWACVEHIHEQSCCRALFATHYHELTGLQSRLPHMSCHSLQVREWKGDIIFMHNVQKGSADRSYGIHVARLAGLPPSVITRAQEVLALLQSGEQSGTLAKLADDLPLFRSSPLRSAPSPKSALEERVKAIEPDTLSPREALEIIYELKKITPDS